MWAIHTYATVTGDDEPTCTYVVTSEAEAEALMSDLTITGQAATFSIEPITT